MITISHFVAIGSLLLFGTNAESDPNAQHYDAFVEFYNVQKAAALCNIMDDCRSAEDNYLSFFNDESNICVVDKFHVLQDDIKCRNKHEYKQLLSDGYYKEIKEVTMWELDEITDIQIEHANDKYGHHEPDKVYIITAKYENKYLQNHCQVHACGTEKFEILNGEIMKYEVLDIFIKSEECKEEMITWPTNKPTPKPTTTTAWPTYKPHEETHPQPVKIPGPNEDLICPFLLKGTPINVPDTEIPDVQTYNHALKNLDINAVFQDIVDLLVDSQDCWPADEFGGHANYGGLFIRLAWHCAGTYRAADGAGGCSGARQRYDPEASWEDNTNLDKARALLYPIKRKYGDALSWGDLFVFAGTASIYALGGPVDQICAGRIDDIDGTASEVLGFDDDPLSATPPCLDQGNCHEGNDVLGAVSIGLIYVNPEGVNGDPSDPGKSAVRIREIFRRMGNNDTETVALIGGGHTFGKSHGACPLGAGPHPDEQPLNPWPGKCGNGRGRNTFTSGIEGYWTSYPFQWDNEYFKLLRDNGEDYELIEGPGGAYQWRNPYNGLMMMTTDLALIHDDRYRQIVFDWADDEEAFDRHFAAAWQKLTSIAYGDAADNSFCINAHELDLDLDEMPIRQDDYYNRE